MTDKKLRVFKLRNAGDEELLKGLEEYKKELNNLRTLKITGGTSAKLGKIRVRIMNIPFPFNPTFPSRSTVPSSYLRLLLWRLFAQETRS